VGRGGTGSKGSGHRPVLGKGAIEETEAPEQATDGIRITAIQRVSIVEVQQSFKGLRYVGAPFEDRLAPGHSKVVVKPATLAKRRLSDVPECIPGSPSGQRLPGSSDPWIVAVGFERLSGPRGHGSRAVVVLVGSTEVERELPPHQEFVEKLVSAFTAAP